MKRYGEPTIEFVLWPFASPPLEESLDGTFVPFFPSLQKNFLGSRESELLRGTIDKVHFCSELELKSNQYVIP